METLAVLPFAEECPCPTVVPSGVGFACLCHRQNVREREGERQRERERERERKKPKGSSDPESHPKVGFELVSGFGFRRLKPTFGFGFRVSGFVD